MTQFGLTISDHDLKHLISTSGEERPYNCELCKKGFLGKTHLVTHFRRYHHDLGAHQIDTLLSFMLKTERYKPS